MRREINRQNFCKTRENCFMYGRLQTMGADRWNDLTLCFGEFFCGWANEGRKFMISNAGQKDHYKQFVDPLQMDLY